MTTDKTLAHNRKARFDYEILDSFEAGVVLLGTEIKAMREGRANITGAFGRAQNGELWLMNSHISQYSASGASSHDPTRPRKLLMHKDQITRLSQQMAQRGLALVPLKLYLNRHHAKLELGLGKGRKRSDKRRAIIDRIRENEAKDAITRR
jgi:SsrA-binding protein